MGANTPPPYAVPRAPLVEIAKVHPALEAMARAVCRVEGNEEDLHWPDYDDKRKVDMGGPAWTYYLDHAREALKVLGTLDPVTLMRGTAAINWDDLPPEDDLGDPDYVDDLNRELKALVAHINREVTA